MQIDCRIKKSGFGRMGKNFAIDLQRLVQIACPKE